jgi:hypothetical protein
MGSAVTLEGVLARLTSAQRDRLTSIQPARTRAAIEALTKPSPRASGGRWRLPAMPRRGDLGVVSGVLSDGVWFHVKGLPLPITKNTRAHRMVIARWDALHLDVTLSALEPLPPVSLPRRVVVVREADSTGLDTDNLGRACAYIRDGVAKWLGIDDSPRSGVEWVNQQVEAAGYGVRVEITGGAR